MSKLAYEDLFMGKEFQERIREAAAQVREDFKKKDKFQGGKQGPKWVITTTHEIIPDEDAATTGRAGVVSYVTLKCPNRRGKPGYVVVSNEGLQDTAHQAANQANIFPERNLKVAEDGGE